MDHNPIRMQLKRLLNDPSMNPRHRRVMRETLRVMDMLVENLDQHKEIEDLFETNERLQTVLAEELEKQA